MCVNVKTTLSGNSAAAGFAWLLVNSDGPEAALMTYVSPSPQPGAPATLTVTFFGRVGYTRAVPDAGAFDTELVCWPAAVFVLVVFAGALGGGLVGCLAGKWPRRTRP
jgi:hypothetical protein